jgi:hypothetical protein
MIRRGRTAIAVIIILSGFAIIAGARLSWIGKRGHRPASGITDTAVTGLLHWSYQACKTYYNSFSFVVLVCGVLVILGGLFASRLLAGVFALIALIAAGLWLGLNASHYSSVNLIYQDLRIGAWLTVGGAIVAIIFAGFVRRRAL